MRKKTFRIAVLLTIFIIMFALIPVKKANATWTYILSERFTQLMASWPWYIMGNSWDLVPDFGYQWGVVTELNHAPFNPEQSIWCAALLNGQLSGLTPFINPYPNNMDTKALWGPFSLADAVAAECNFWHWTDTETYNDYLLWGASLDQYGNTIYEGGRVSGRNSDWEWDNAVMDLSDLEDPNGNPFSVIGQSNVWIVFYFHSNGYNPPYPTYYGSFVDDIMLGWSDGLFDLIALYSEFVDADSNVITEPMEGQPYYLRFRWEVEGEGETAPFNIECEVDHQFFFTTRQTAVGDTTYYTYTDQMWSGNLGSHNLQWTLDVDNEITETYEDNNIYFMEFEVVEFDSAPWIVITRPTEGDTANEGFWIEWEDYDRESDAMIFLYYDVDTTGPYGYPINLAPIYEDSDPDSFWWDTSYLPDSSEYFICGIIDDGANPWGVDYSDYPLFIYHPTSVGEGASGIPAAFRLEQNYPNPFNAATMITYSTPEPASVDLSVYDIGGRLVERLAQGNISPGHHSTVWNPDVGSGVYFCRIYMVGLNSGKQFSSSCKMLYVR